jgi:hypothetical protein
VAFLISLLLWPVPFYFFKNTVQNLFKVAIIKPMNHRCVIVHGIRLHDPAPLQGPTYYHEVHYDTKKSDLVIVFMNFMIFAYQQIPGFKFFSL